MAFTGNSPYLRFIQRTGATKHPGGFLATDALLKRAELTKDSQVLDVGCGAGHTAAHIAKTFGCTVFGVDCSPEAIERARAIYAKDPFIKNMHFEIADVTDLSGITGQFDVVLCESVLVFVNDKPTALSEMARLVKPHGFLALNELCSGKDDTTNFFSRPEIGGFLTSSNLLKEWFSEALWKLVVVDEEPFDLVAQVKADWLQWGNFKGLVQILEASFQVALDKQLQEDAVSVLKLAIKAPKDLFTKLHHLLLLAQKKGP